MRTGGIIRIVVGVVVAVLLTALLVLSLKGVNVFKTWNLYDEGWLSSRSAGGASSDMTTAEETVSVSADGIDRIKINWVAGNVEIRSGDGGEITFSESAAMQLSDSQKMRYSVSGGTLKIEYCSSTVSQVWEWFRFGRYENPAKDLVVTVPASLMGTLEELDVDGVSAGLDVAGVYGRETSFGTVSGGIECADINCDQLNLSTTSGGISGENCTASKLDIDSVSGGADLAGAFEKVNIETVSGGVRLDCTTAPEKIDGDSVSGTITVSLPEGSGFVVELETVSGEISCDFAGTMSGDKITCGDGSGSYQLNSVSGGVRIEQN